MPRKESPLNSLELRKQLLIAESEILRAQLLQDGEIILAGVHSITRRARSIGSLASLAGLLTAGFVAFRRSKGVFPVGKTSWLRTALNGAKTLVPLWFAFRRRSQNEDSDAPFDPSRS